MPGGGEASGVKVVQVVMVTVRIGLVRDSGGGFGGGIDLGWRGDVRDVDG